MKNWLPYDYLKTMKLKITVYSSRKEIIYWVNIHTAYLPWDDKCRWRSYTMSITNRWLSIMGTKLHLNSTHMKLCENICHGTVMMFCFNSGLPHLLEILVAWYLFKDHSTIEVHSIHDVFWKNPPARYPQVPWQTLYYQTPDWSQYLTAWAVFGVWTHLSVV